MLCKQQLIQSKDKQEIAGENLRNKNLVVILVAVVTESKVPYSFKQRADIYSLEVPGYASSYQLKVNLCPTKN